MEKIKTVGLVREPGFLYYLNRDGICRVQMKVHGSSELMIPAKIQRDSGFMYFIDKDGDISRVVRKVGGTKKRGS